MLSPQMKVVLIQKLTNFYFLKEFFAKMLPSWWMNTHKNFVLSTFWIESKTILSNNVTIKRNCLAVQYLSTLFKQMEKIQKTKQSIE